jgi:CelD/BcsL family acetyltransferase involved in cellulose biosynthesis
MSSTALFRPETEIAGRGIKRRGPVSVSTSLGTISLRITGDLPALKGLWEAMQAAAPCTAPQTFDWAQAWNQRVLAPQGREAVIVVGYGADGTPLFLWPFETATEFGFRVLKWLGQEHANYNMGLFTPEAAQGLKSADIARLLRAAARRAGATAALFDAQPFEWDGRPNPFAAISHQRAPNRGYAIKLGDFTALYESRFSKRSRSTLERKERRLLEMGTVRFGWAETRDEKIALLDTFFAQKAKQFAAMGVTDVFDAPARAFYRDVALLEGDNPSRLRLGYVSLNGKVLATFSGTVCHDRMSVALSSLAEGEVQRQSPGGLLLKHQIEDAAKAGLAFYDLGVGQARHKDEWCNVEQTLFDSFIAFKPQGLLVTLPLAVAAQAKRAIKSNRHLWSLAQSMRRRLLGRED